MIILRGQNGEADILAKKGVHRIQVISGDLMLYESWYFPVYFQVKAFLSFGRRPFLSFGLS